MLHSCYIGVLYIYERYILDGSFYLYTLSISPISTPLKLKNVQKLIKKIFFFGILLIHLQRTAKLIVIFLSHLKLIQWFVLERIQMKNQWFSSFKMTDLHRNSLKCWNKIFPCFFSTLNKSQWSNLVAPTVIWHIKTKCQIRD